MRKKIRKIPVRRLSAAILCVLAILVGLYRLAVQGFRYIEPASVLRRAEETWETGCRGQSLRSYVQASTMAVEAGLRGTIARIYINQMMSNISQGELDRALDGCSRAVAILQDYDNEGSLSYECFVIEGQIKRQSELE